MDEKRLITLENISKEYDGVTVLNNINLYIRKKEFVTLLGPSGCGKTTTLRIIGGFETPDTGRVVFDGQDITGLPAYKRRVNTVFQKYALFPHLNVQDNIAFGLKLKKMPKEEIARKVDYMLDLVNLKGFNKRGVDSLSGGQQQRIAIARALVNEPEVLLLDEPLGALDLKLRKEMQLELKAMQQRLGITFLYVTHDQEEALTMSDTIVVMRSGNILQSAPPNPSTTSRKTPSWPISSAKAIFSPAPWCGTSWCISAARISPAWTVASGKKSPWTWWCGPRTCCWWARTWAR